ncbi:MAG: ROK family protein [Acidobacteria bacterium]|nr:ROK family protein [Acidobacteriota bacterium]
MASAKKSNEHPDSKRTLAVDIGGTGIKVMVLDENGRPLTERSRVGTPQPATPSAVLGAIVGLVKKQDAFSRASVGFPGVVRNGITETAPNLNPAWKGFNLAQTLSRRLGKPVRVANDADVQGFGAITGRGVELVVTLGTGLGSALFVNGRLVPNLEVAHHAFRKGKTYEENLGNAALKKAGKKKWNKTLRRAILELERLFNYDFLFIGGGNAKKIAGGLPTNVKVVSNVAGLLGGIALWRD